MSDGTFRGRWIDEVFRTPSISDAVRVALLALALEMDDAGEVSLPRRELAERLARSERRMDDRIGTAIQAGLLERTSRGHRSRTAAYRATLPGSVSATPGGRTNAGKRDDPQRPFGAGKRDDPQRAISEQHDTRGSRNEDESATPGGRATYKARTDLSDHGDGAMVVALFDDKKNSTPSLRSQPRARARGAAADGEHSAFAEWYAAYPVHKARGAAVKAFTKAAKKTDPETLIAAAKRYRDDPQVQRGYAKHPATWLNQECWLDEPAPAPTAPALYQSPGHDPSGTDARVAGWAALAAELDRNQP